ncbi:MAG: hypothetical protein MRJ96_03450 [Nitrospirales bacterium]|nr:hypothetical protein [Nitrospira sp.]MDR4500494.1 hypothetical protein [Nitrospirales bacterium]
MDILTPSSFSSPVDFRLALGIGFTLLSVVYWRILTVAGKTRKQFHALQPEVRITNRATVYSNGQDVLTLSLRNNGGSPAEKIRVMVHGYEGERPMPIIAQLNPWTAEQEVWVRVKSNSPLLRERRSNIRLIIRYQDQWGNRYSLTYPVVQRECTKGGMALQIVDRGEPRISMPAISFWQMRRYLVCHARQVRKGKNQDLPFRGQICTSHDDSLSQSFIHSYLGKVWQTQNKWC